MKTKERLYGKITANIPSGCERTVTYYILDSAAEIHGDTVRVYGLKAEENGKNGGKPLNKRVIDVSSSLEEVECLAKNMLTEFVALPLFEDVIEDHVAG